MAIDIILPQEEQREERVEINIQSLLESGAHFGSKKSDWHPKSAGFIYGIRNDIYIINLETTLECWNRAKVAVSELIARGGKILLVGTKDKVRDELVKVAEKTTSFYVTSRWLGGTLTNLDTLKKSVIKLKKLENLVQQAEASESNIILTKKEILDIKKEVYKLNRFFGGLREMNKLPDLVFITDVTRDHLALIEARRLGIPVVAIVDTNSDPSTVTYPIPANDDAVSTQILFLRGMRDVILEGLKERAEAELIQSKLKEETLKQAEERIIQVVVEPPAVVEKVKSEIPVTYRK